MESRAQCVVTPHKRNACCMNLLGCQCYALEAFWQCVRDNFFKELSGQTNECHGHDFGRGKQLRLFGSGQSVHVGMAGQVMWFEELR